MTPVEPSQLFIDGAWVDASGSPEPIENPATGKVIGAMGCASAADVDRAVAAAVSAMAEGPWSRMTGFDRRRLMLRWADELDAAADEIGGINTDEVGMPLSFTVGTVQYCSEYVEHFAGWADKLGGDSPAMPQRHLLDYTIRHPVGVVAAIVPWNIPVFITAAKLAPALAAGCAVVLKPSELAPGAPLAMVAAAERAGFPPGVVNAVTGLGDTGAALVAHPGVAMISFTGGTDLGARIGAEAARAFKRTTLELGGKSANIVFADADLDRAVDGVVQGFVINTGQQCTAGSRVLVQRSVYDDVVERVAAHAGTYTVGDPRDPATLVGPLITEAHLESVLARVAAAGDTGRVVLGGERLGGDLADGWFLSPTVVADADLSTPLCREETFGPIATITPFDTEDEAVALADDSPFGLVAGVWTSDVGTAHRVAGRLHTGTVWVNTYLQVLPSSPFGGHKASGLGREGGREAALGFTETTNVMVDVSAPRKDPS